jgi:calcium-dependent protein kinase
MNYSHRKHIIHHDLKPENVMFKTRDPDSPLAILDFGDANIFHLDVALTKHSGTPYYMAPEVISGEHNQKSDVWSVGVMLYIMLT